VTDKPEYSPGLGLIGRTVVDDILPEDVKQFLLQHIDSIAQLEGLLLFYADPQKAWNTETIAHRLFISEAETIIILTRLWEQGFVVLTSDPPQHYRYQPKSPEWQDMVTRMADQYRRYLVPITHLIHSKSKSRIQEFADAFRIRKD